MSWDGWVFRALVERLKNLVNSIEIVRYHDHQAPVRVIYDTLAKFGEMDRRPLPSGPFDLEAQLRYTEFITPHIAKIGELSPSLSRDLNDLREQGWKIEFEAPWRTDPQYFDKKVLNIPSSEITEITSDAARTVHHIAEQVARAQTRSISRIIAKPDLDVTQEDWRSDQVQKLLDARSVRYLEAARVRHEILDRKGPDIDADWSETETVTAAQRLYGQVAQESKTWDTAIQEMGEVVGRQPLPVPPDLDLKTWFGHVADEFWQAHQTGTWLE
ncbi:hypothetical protein [Nocardia altamirensis]|uniref:hypothetical protein n=1 Tax=Nocardia altamirensis TaxID=472158 RepID=UPI0008404B6A|nr:hypothetical protein [Nocardia altamirensis]